MKTKKKISDVLLTFSCIHEKRTLKLPYDSYNYSNDNTRIKVVIFASINNNYGERWPNGQGVCLATSESFVRTPYVYSYTMLAYSKRLFLTMLLGAEMLTDLVRKIPIIRLKCADKLKITNIYSGSFNLHIPLPEALYIFCLFVGTIVCFNHYH